MYTVNPPLPIVGSDTDWNDTLRVPHLFKYLPTVVDVINPSTVQAPLTNQTFKNTQLATVVDPIVWKNDVPKLRQSNKCPANVLSSVFCVAIRKSNQRSTCCCCCKPVQDTLMQMTTEGESQAFTSRQIAPVKHLMIIDWDARDLINARLQWPHQLTLSVVDFRPNPQDLWIPPFVLLSNTWDCNCLCLWLRFRNCRPDCSCLCNCRPNCSCLYNCRPNHNSLCYCRTAWGWWRRCWGLCCLKFHRWRSTRSRFGWWIHWLLWSRWRHTWTNLRWWICWFLWNGCRWRMYWFFRNGCRWRMFWLFRNCYRGWYRITFPSEARIPSQPLAKKTAWIYWQLRRNHESTLISSSLKNLTQKRITKRILCVLLWLTLWRRFRKNNCLYFRHTVNRNFFLLILTQVFLESRQNNLLAIRPTPLQKLQPFPHLMLPLHELSAPSCPWIKKCQKTNNVLKKDFKQMTMDCPRPLLRLNTSPMCPPVPQVSFQDTLQTPGQWRSRALSRLRWCRRSPHARSSNDTHQLVWAIGRNWTSEVWICSELS